MEKSILVDFDQFITPVNKWKANWVYEGYSWFKKKTPKRSQCRQYSLHLIYFFLLRRQLQGSMKVRSMKVSTNQWHNYGSVHLAIFDHLWVLEIVSGLNSVECMNSEETKKRRGKNFRKGSNDYLNLVFTYVTFNMRDDLTKT